MMKATRFAGRLRMTLRKFCTGQGGNIIIPFTLLLVPIMGAVGAAVDYSRASSDRASMQAAVDAAALILSKNIASLGASQIGPAATNYFKANFNRTDVSGIAVTSTYTTTGGSQLVVTATGTVPTTFIKILGITTVDISASSTVKWGNSRLRVALVLDNTGSMATSNKMTALKNATNSLLTQLKTSAVNNGDVYVSIIPFAKDVAVDVTGITQAWIDAAQTWIDWTDWLAEPANLDTARGGSKPSNWSSIGPGDSCPFTDSSHGFRCTTGPATGASTTNSIPSSGNYDGYICPSMDSGRRNTTNANVYYNGCYDSSTYSCTGSSCTCTGHSNCSCNGNGNGKKCKQPDGYSEHTWRPSGTPAELSRTKWNGCMTDRGDSTAPNSGNYDTNVAAPNASIPASKFPAEQYASCPRPVMGLNYNWAAMTTLVNSMTPDGNTNQAIGLAWGWLSLVGGGPFTNIPAMDTNYTYQQVIILLTDGLNTENRWYTNQASIDARQQITCNNINAAGITLYAVQVNTGSDPTSALLKNCAGTASPRKYPDPDKFFLLTSADQIVTTFAAIGTELSNLRVAK